MNEKGIVKVKINAKQFSDIIYIFHLIEKMVDEILMWVDVCNRFFRSINDKEPDIHIAFPIGRGFKCVSYSISDIRTSDSEEVILR